MYGADLQKFFTNNMNLALKYFTLAEQGFLCTFLALKEKIPGQEQQYQRTNGPNLFVPN